MRRITTWLLSTVTALVLLFSYHTSTSSGAATSIVAAGTDTGTGSTSGAAPHAQSGSSDSGSGSPSDDSGSSTGTGSSPDTSGSPSSAAKTYSGDAVSTRFGDVQVEITVDNGRITDSRVLQVPWNDHKDQEINSRAVPILNSEAVEAQSADIDMVSGATYTSQGYLASLQSAIDRANL